MIGRRETGRLQDGAGDVAPAPLGGAHEQRVARPVLREPSAHVPGDALRLCRSPAAG